MRKIVLAVVPVLALLLLSSRCVPLPSCTPFNVQFSQENPDPIFRGTWTGTVEDYPMSGDTSDLVMDVTATREGEFAYTVEGTFQLGSRDERALTGRVGNTGCAERYLASSSNSTRAESLTLETDISTEQAAPPDRSNRLEAEVRDASDTLLWSARARWRLGELTDDTVFMRLTSETEDLSRYSELTRTDAP